MTGSSMPGGCRYSASKDVHVRLTALPQSPPPSAVPLPDPCPSLMRRDLFDPDQDRAEGKVGVCELVTHNDDPIALTVTHILVKDVG